MTKNETWCETLFSDAERRGSLRKDLGRGLGFAIFHSNYPLLFNDVLTTGGRSEYTILIDKCMSSYASLRLWQLPVTICNAFEILMTRLGIFRNFLQPRSQKA